MERLEQIIRDVCELEPADPDHPDTVCVKVADLERILARQPEAAGAVEVVAWTWTHPDGDSGSWWDIKKEPEGSPYMQRMRAQGCSIAYAYSRPPATAALREQAPPAGATGEGHVVLDMEPIQNDDSLIWTYGIDIGKHGWAIECHGEKKEDALRRAQRVASALAQAAPGDVDVAMALHWIDRYAAGIDAECQIDRIAAALREQAHTAGSVDVEHSALRVMKREPGQQEGESASQYAMRIATAALREQPKCMDCAYNPGCCDTHDTPAGATVEEVRTRFEQCAANLVSEDYATGYREALSHVSALAQAAPGDGCLDCAYNPGCCDTHDAPPGDDAAGGGRG